MEVASPTAHFNGDAPRKRRKYVPGGPGGGGHWIETDQLETPRPRPPPRVRSSSGRPVGRPRTVGRPRRHPPAAQPMRSSTSAEAAAAVQSDGYKPREERGWEEFHPDLDIEFDLPVFTAQQVDGVTLEENKENLVQNDDSVEAKVESAIAPPPSPSYSFSTPKRRGPGRPPKHRDTMLSGLGSPTPPRITPLPAQNPRERLNLPKPSYRRVETFAEFEHDRANQINFVDRPMAAVGFQESEMYFRKDKSMVRLNENRADEDPEPNLLLEADIGVGEERPAPVVNKVEYDMDEQDQQWLDEHNVWRKGEGVDIVKPAIFEITMTQIEKEWNALEKRIPKPNPKPPQTHRPRSSSAAAVNGEPAGEEQDSKCAICDDGDCENTNAIVFCDGCDLAVHQECYGVPFIPEGQWLCRKCQFIGKSTPTCIFCPNTEGAFKLTTQQKWVHLLCSIWIPEVSIANTTFMEPVDGVPQVPKNRWKLVCYICNQRMGACIQCGNKNCYAAFHVTCARRAKLYLKMKSSHGGLATTDPSILKAMCDKHSPSEWRANHDVETATAEAKAFYRRTLKGRRWADSATAALSQNAAPQVSAVESIEDATEPANQQKETAAQKKKKLEALQKNIWRLPSGAPVVPQAVFNAVESSLIRFTIRKRKEYVAEACKYWTLKREARRGAALLKRLQQQMETFSTSEITRRDFGAMGAAGGPKLQRRIDFAGQLLKDMERLIELCRAVKERESDRLTDAELLTRTVDLIYFPILTLLWPILERAITLDPRKFFAEGFRELQVKLETRQYTSVAEFSADLAKVFKNVVGLDAIENTTEAHNQLAAAPIRDMSLTVDQRDLKKLAKRIIKAVQSPLEMALQKESELSGRPFELDLANLDVFLNRPAADASNDAGDQNDAKQASTPQPPAVPPTENGPVHPESPASLDQDLSHGDEAQANPAADTTSASNEMPDTSTSARPPTPPRSEDSLLATFSSGGIPWYLEPFDITGTTIHDERWTGRDVLRGMSEELSDIDENALADFKADSSQSVEADAGDEVDEAGGTSVSPKRSAAKRAAPRRSTRKR